MAIGFMVASYSILANDAIQTLGTFLASNRSRPWWVLWLYAVGILYAVLIYGWMTHDGDTSYGRLDRIPLPRPFTWIYLVPPLVLLLLTKRGIPVSTTFLILTLFAPESLGDMMVKSLLGYAVAFLFGIVLLVFKEWSRIPMSTTWVFLGLLAGREIAMSVRLRSRPMPETLRLVRNYGMRITAGLAVSVLLAIALPRLSALITPVDQTTRLSSTGKVFPAARLNPSTRK